jgi:hypothetical protein
MISIAIGFSFVGLVIVGILVGSDNYFSPFCKDCGDNSNTRRKDGKPFCKVHGSIRAKDSVRHSNVF